MNHTEIINYLIKKYNLKSYLEIGVLDGGNFNQIQCEQKVGIEPDSGKLNYFAEDGVFKYNDGLIYRMKSDAFFGIYDSILSLQGISPKFDLIFIDGLHIAEQVKKDLDNSVRYLNDNGFIVVHDCNPPTEQHAKEEWILLDWNGTVYKGFIEWKFENEQEYDSQTIDTDWGCGIIRKKMINVDEVFDRECHLQMLKETDLYNFSWEHFDKNRKQILNLITVEEFKQLY